MNLNKRQKTFLIIFFVGLVALVVDRTILRPQGGPSAASAESFVAPEGSVLPAGDAPAPGGAPPGPGLAERMGPLWLPEPADFERVRDPFVLPPSWFEALGGAGEAGPDPAALFAERHQLTAVVVDGQVSYALVDDRFIALGQQVEDFTLISVSDRVAVFEHRGKRAFLELRGK